MSNTSSSPTLQQHSQATVAPSTSATSQANETTRRARGQGSAAPTSSSAGACRDFLLGRCRYGDKCKFVHKKLQQTAEGTAKSSTLNCGAKGKKFKSKADSPGNMPSSSTSLQAQGQSLLRPQLNGSNNLSPTTNNASSSASQPQSSGASNAKKPCYNWKAGKCFRGDKCRYSHDPIERDAQQQSVLGRARMAEEKAARLAQEAARQRARLAAEEAARIREAKRLETEQEAARRREARAREEATRKALLAEQEALRNKQEAAFNTQHIVLGSTLITCGAGLEVRGVVSGFDSCRLTIRGLPSNATATEIAELFTQQGMSRDDIHILSINPANGDRREAKVLTSADQGGAIAVGLDGIEFRNETLHFETSENISTDAMGESSAWHADTLAIIWSAPSASMIAKYSSMDDARAQARALNQVVIGGRRIKAEMNPPPTGPALRFYDPASVKMTGLPVDVSINTVMELAGTMSVRPIKSTTYNLQELLVDLRQHLASLPDTRMNSFTTHLDRQVDGLVTVKARFESWDHANSARASLDGKRLKPDYPHFRFSLPQPLHFISTIPLQQFDSQKQMWDSLADTNHNKGPRVHLIRNPERGIVRIKLSGDDEKAVGALKVRVETLVAGEKLDTTYWHRSFLWPKGREFLSKIYSETGVHVRGDFKIQALKIYGEGTAKENARQMIEDEVARLAQLEWTVVLKRQSVGYFVRKGLAALKEVLGEDAVTLDLASTPCKLTIRGGEEARHALGTLMDQSLNDIDLHIPGGGNDICPICYDAVSHPIKLGCKHVYCTACLRHYLTSAAETKIFPLVCMGDEANCKVPLPIPVIQRFLVRQQYEHLINVMFSTYLDRHPQDFKYCTTPDCTQIYRANTKTMLKCPSCFAEVCSSCHEEAHEGMTCEERRARKAQEQDQLNDQWATIHGVKRCPSCQVLIEKTEGCNHMSCRCGAHMCWICLKTFSAGDQVYQHLGSVHGGAFDGDGERLNNDLQHALALQRQLDERDPVPVHPRLGHVPRPPPVPVAAVHPRLGHVPWPPGPAPVAAVHGAPPLVHRQQLEALDVEAQLRRQAAQRRQAEVQRVREEYQRQFDERQARLIREAEQRRRQEGGWGCTVM